MSEADPARSIEKIRAYQHGYEVRVDEETHSWNELYGPALEMAASLRDDLKDFNRISILDKAENDKVMWTTVSNKKMSQLPPEI